MQAKMRLIKLFLRDAIFPFVLKVPTRTRKHWDAVNKFRVTNGHVRASTRASMRILEEVHRSVGALVGSTASPMAN